MVLINNNYGKLYNEDGSVKYEGEIKNGKMDGKGIIYWRTGQVRYEGKFKNDMLDGDVIQYNMSGKEVFKGKYKENKKHGMGIEYHVGSISIIKFIGEYRNGLEYDGIGSYDNYIDEGEDNFKFTCDLYEKVQGQLLYDNRLKTYTANSVICNLESWNNLIEKASQIYWTNSEIMNLIQGYIIKASDELFLNKAYFLLFEYTIIASSIKSNNGIPLLDDYMYEKIINSFKNENKKNLSFLLKIENYKLENFDYLSKIIYKKHKFSSFQECVLITWLLLYFGAIKFYAQLWHQDYSEYFHDIVDLNLDECINRFANLTMIDLNDERSIAIFTYYLIDNRKFTYLVLERFKAADFDFIDCYYKVLSMIEAINNNKKIDNYENLLLNKIDINDEKININDTDLMDGIEFEQFICKMFQKFGYRAIVTKGSGDQGVDVIVEKNGRKIGIQAKCYSNTVSNSAIQEVVAGIKYYNLDRAMVITNNYFTKSAIALATSNNVILWDRTVLKNKISEVFEK